MIIAQKNKRTSAEQHEKALFDFDEEIDDLEQIENRYPAQPVDAPKPPKSKVPVQFQVKRAQRPAFLNNVLEKKEEMVTAP